MINFQGINKFHFLNFKRRLSPINTELGNTGFKLPVNKFPKKLSVIILMLLLVVISFSVGKMTQNTAGAIDQKTEAPKAKATQVLNKGFMFDLKDDKGKTVSKSNYMVESAELQDSILVKGQIARAVRGKTFLIFNLKITNNYNKAIVVNTRDFMRLIINNSKEFLAPDIHNDPVQIQGVSTKYTRLGFPISEDYKSLKLQIGQIEGKKETINLNFK